MTFAHLIDLAALIALLGVNDRAIAQPLKLEPVWRQIIG